LAQETFLRILSLTKRELLGSFCQWDEAQGFFFDDGNRREAEKQKKKMFAVEIRMV